MPRCGVDHVPSRALPLMTRVLLLVIAVLSSLTVAGGAVALAQPGVVCGSCGPPPVPRLSASQLLRYDFDYGGQNYGSTVVLRTRLGIFFDGPRDTTHYACVDDGSMDRLRDDLRTIVPLRVPYSQLVFPFPRSAQQLLLFRLGRRQKMISSNPGDEPNATPMPGYARRLIRDLVALRKRDQRRAADRRPKSCRS